MAGIRDSELEGLTRAPWFDIGWKSADAYARNKEWLFRRVETIEFVNRASVKRSVNVDFEVPKQVPKLGQLAAKGARMVPISVLQKWPPLTDFELLGPNDRLTSLYRRTTIKKLDFGLLLGMVDRALDHGVSEADRRPRKQRRRSAREFDHASADGLPPRLRRELAALVQEPIPSDQSVENAVNNLSRELHDRLDATLIDERIRGEEKVAAQIAATVDLAARLAGSSTLWVAVTGTPGTDRIVRFSYLSDYAPSQAERDWWKKVEIMCSWRRRTRLVHLLHTGRQVRYHLDVHAPEGSVELDEIKVMALPAASFDDGHDGATIRSIMSLADKYPQLDIPDELVGPETGGLFLDYGAPIILVSSSPTPGNDGANERDVGDERSVQIVDRCAHVYLGPEGAPSHRVLMQVKLAAPRQGFIQGCMIAALVITTLMWAVYLTLPSAALHLDSTAVLLAVVPVVLGYVLVRPGEQALERDHIIGVRSMAALSGATPIVGALTLILTHHGTGSMPDLGVAEPIWLGLAILSSVLAAGLVASFVCAAPPRKSEESAVSSSFPSSE